VFGPLVVAEEGRRRGALLAQPELLTDYERRTLEAARRLTPAELERAWAGLAEIRRQVARLFTELDILATPATAVPAFPLRLRPRMIADEPVSTLWGAFPFTAPFNVAGVPALTVPTGLVDELPIGIQLVAGRGADDLLLDVAESLQEALAFDMTVVLDSLDVC
jgi:Asp-tRNA(Asn)/Glu-tRNA(Gln) amidotransferase A subunit family amidase